MAMRQPLGRDELRQAMGTCRVHFMNVGIFSIFVNLLMLTGPLFMLQVYDRVLASRSEATLVALLLLVTLLFAFMGILEFIRGRVLSRAGARFQTLLDQRIFTAVMRRSVAPAMRAQPNTAARDMDSIRQLLGGPAPFALFDVPWVPIYIGAIFLFHPVLGWIAVAGGAVLVVLTLVNQARSRRPNMESQKATSEAENLGEQLRQNAEAVQGLGMMNSGMGRWNRMRQSALDAQVVASDRTASYTSASKALRFYLQSVMLAAGAWLVLQQLISPGMMIAGSILMGRALAPIEQAIGQWPLGQRAWSGWKSLSELLQKTPPPEQRTKLPVPKGHVLVQNITVAAPGEQVAALRGVSFEIKPGQALGVIGPSGAGKTTLAKVLVGIWHPAAGKVRIDGAALDQWDQDELGRHIGYLPQEIGLMSGTVAQNIARLSEQPEDAKIIDAAQRAGAHELLLSLPQGYDTEIGAGGQRLSGGQRQRVALARALYNDPPVLVLDEPNANLDAPGEQALVDCIRDARSRGKTVIIMAHRPSAIAACDLLLMIDKGQQIDFGPRDEVLKKRTRNYPQLTGGRKGQAPDQEGKAPTPLAAAAEKMRPAGAQTVGAKLGTAGPGILTGGAQQTRSEPPAAPKAALPASGARPADAEVAAAGDEKMQAAPATKPEPVKTEVADAAAKPEAEAAPGADTQKDVVSGMPPSKSKAPTEAKTEPSLKALSGSAGGGSASQPGTDAPATDPAQARVEPTLTGREVEPARIGTEAGRSKGGWKLFNKPKAGKAADETAPQSSSETTETKS